MSIIDALRKWLQEIGRGMKLLLFFLFLAVGLILILLVDLGGASIVAAEGELARSDILASRNHTFISEVLTQKAREQARRDVDEVYTPLDLSIGREQLSSARDIFAFIETVRADSNATTNQKLGYLNAIEDVVLEEEIAQSLLSMSQSSLGSAENNILEIINELMREEIREIDLRDYRRSAQNDVNLELAQTQSNVVTALVPQFIMPTIFADEEATALRRDEAAAQIEPLSRSVIEGQLIVRVGETIDAADIELLSQLGLLKQELNQQEIGSRLLVSLLVATIITLYWRQFPSVKRRTQRYLSVLAGLILLFALIAKTMVVGVSFLPFLFPLAALSMLLAVVYDVRLAVIVTVLMAAFVGYISSNAFELGIYTAVGGLLAILTLNDAGRVVSFFRAGLVAALAHMIAVLIFRLPQDIDTTILLQQLGVGLANGVLSAALTLAGFFILGGLFGIITILQLQDLSRLDHPLLKQLLRRAPGTYHHSIMVANLAEQAAEEIGADCTLVRVGAFYHDIGKMVRPPFFTENQEGISPHDSIDAYTSARIIVNHVTDGMVLAKKYRLPYRLQDFIVEHHGKRLVKGFYHKARSLAGDDEGEVDAEQFRYPGPRPRSRESGIVMLADAIEATSSALRPNSVAAIEKLVSAIVDEDLLEGQLDESGLTIGDIQQLRNSFIETLHGRFHVRIKYPGNEALEVDDPKALAAPPPALPEMTPQTSSSSLIVQDTPR